MKVEERRKKKKKKGKEENKNKKREEREGKGRLDLLLCAELRNDPAQPQPAYVQCPHPNHHPPKRRPSFQAGGLTFINGNNLS